MMLMTMECYKNKEEHDDDQDAEARQRQGIQTSVKIKETVAICGM